MALPYLQTEQDFNQTIPGNFKERPSCRRQQLSKLKNCESVVRKQFNVKCKPCNSPRKVQKKKSAKNPNKGKTAQQRRKTKTAGTQKPNPSAMQFLEPQPHYPGEDKQKRAGEPETRQTTCGTQRGKQQVVAEERSLDFTNSSATPAPANDRIEVNSFTIENMAISTAHGVKQSRIQRTRHLESKTLIIKLENAESLKIKLILFPNGVGKNEHKSVSVFVQFMEIIQQNGEKLNLEDVKGEEYLVTVFLNNLDATKVLKKTFRVFKSDVVKQENGRCIKGLHDLVAIEQFDKHITERDSVMLGLMINKRRDSQINAFQDSKNSKFNSK